MAILPSERLVLDAQIPNELEMWRFMTNAVLDLEPDTAIADGTLSLVRFDAEAEEESREHAGRTVAQEEVQVHYTVPNSLHLMRAAVIEDTAKGIVERHVLLAPTLRLLGGAGILDYATRSRVRQTLGQALSSEGFQTGVPQTNNSLFFERDANTYIGPYVQESYILAQTER